MDDVRPLGDEVIQHTHGQAQGQQQRGGSVEGKAEAQDIHHLRRYSTVLESYTHTVCA